MLDQTIIESLAARPATSADLADAHPDLTPRTLFNPLRRLVRTGRLAEHHVPCKPADPNVPVFTLADAEPPGGVVVDRRWYPDGQAPPSRGEQRAAREQALRADRQRLVLDAIASGFDTTATIASATGLADNVTHTVLVALLTGGLVTRSRTGGGTTPHSYRLAGAPAAGAPASPSVSY